MFFKVCPSPFVAVNLNIFVNSGRYQLREAKTLQATYGSQDERGCSAEEVDPEMQSARCSGVRMFHMLRCRSDAQVSDGPAADHNPCTRRAWTNTWDQWSNSLSAEERGSYRDLAMLSNMGAGVAQEQADQAILPVPEFDDSIDDDAEAAPTAPHPLLEDGAGQLVELAVDLSTVKMDTDESTGTISKQTNRPLCRELVEMCGSMRTIAAKWDKRVGDVMLEPPSGDDGSVKVPCEGICKVQWLAEGRSFERAQVFQATMKAIFCKIIAKEKKEVFGRPLILDLFEFRGFVGGDLKSSKFVWLAFASLKPIFFVMIECEKLGEDQQEIKPEFPYMVQPFCVTHVASSVGAFPPGDVGAMKAWMSQDWVANVLRDPEVAEQEGSEWYLAQLQYTPVCLSDPDAHLGLLSVTGRSGEATRLDEVKEKTKRRRVPKKPAGMSAAEADLLGGLDNIDGPRPPRKRKAKDNSDPSSKPHKAPRRRANRKQDEKEQPNDSLIDDAEGMQDSQIEVHPPEQECAEESEGIPADDDTEATEDEDQKSESPAGDHLRGPLTKARPDDLMEYEPTSPASESDQACTGDGIIVDGNGCGGDNHGQGQGNATDDAIIQGGHLHGDFVAVDCLEFDDVAKTSDADNETDQEADGKIEEAADDVPEGDGFDSMADELDAIVQESGIDQVLEDFEGIRMQQDREMRLDGEPQEVNRGEPPLAPPEAPPAEAPPAPPPPEGELALDIPEPFYNPADRKASRIVT